MRSRWRLGGIKLEDQAFLMVEDLGASLVEMLVMWMWMWNWVVRS